MATFARRRRARAAHKKILHVLFWIHRHCQWQLSVSGFCGPPAPPLPRRALAAAAGRVSRVTAVTRTPRLQGNSKFFLTRTLAEHDDTMDHPFMKLIYDQVRLSTQLAAVAEFSEWTRTVLWFARPHFSQAAAARLDGLH